MEKKAIRFDVPTMLSVQEHANSNNNGNYTKSVIQLIHIGLGVESEQGVKQEEQSQEESGGIRHHPC